MEFYIEKKLKLIIYWHTHIDKDWIELPKSTNQQINKSTNQQINKSTWMTKKNMIEMLCELEKVWKKM